MELHFLTIPEFRFNSLQFMLKTDQIMVKLLPTEYQGAALKGPIQHDPKHLIYASEVSASSHCGTTPPTGICCNRMSRSIFFCFSAKLRFTSFISLRRRLRQASQSKARTGPRELRSSTPKWSSLASLASSASHAGSRGMLRSVRGLLLIYFFAQIDGLRGSGRRNND